MAASTARTGGCGRVVTANSCRVDEDGGSADGLRKGDRGAGARTGCAVRLSPISEGSCPAQSIENYPGAT